MGTANPLGNKGLVVDNITKVNFIGLWKRRPVLGDDAQRDRTMPVLA